MAGAQARVVLQEVVAATCEPRPASTVALWLPAPVQAVRGVEASAEQVVATAAKPGRPDMTAREAAGPEHKQVVAPAERAVGTPVLGRLGRQGTAPQAVRFCSSSWPALTSAPAAHLTKLGGDFASWCWQASFAAVAVADGMVVVRRATAAARQQAVAVDTFLRAAG